MEVLDKVVWSRVFGQLPRLWNDWADAVQHLRTHSSMTAFLMVQNLLGLPGIRVTRLSASITSNQVLSMLVLLIMRQRKG
jgi:hypothetical protein